MSEHTTTKGAKGITPGPWEWTYEDASMQTLHGPDWGYDHVLAVTPCKACQERGARCLGPREDDARLIAAAPDMLEALENLENDDGHIPKHAWDMVQAAIAKARGEDS